MPDSFAWVSYVLSACLAIGLVLSAGAVGLAQEEKTLIEWKFDQPGNLKGWTPNGHMKDTAVADGRLKTKVIDWDPFLIGPPCDIPATPFQRIEVRMRATGLPEAGTGLAEFFWTNTTETKYGGFSPGKQTPFQVQGDGQWRTYSVHPFWHAEKKIIRLRLDLPRDKGEYEIEWIRVVEEAPGPAATSPRWEFDDGPGGWRASEGVSQMTCKNGLLSLVAASGESRLVSPPLQVQALDNPYVAIRMAVDKGDTAQITFASSKTNGLHKTSFPIKPDGQMRTYNLDLGANARWDDKIIALALRPTMTAGANVRIDFIRISDTPQGPAQLEVSGFGLTGAVNRAGRPGVVTCTLKNVGGETATQVRAKLTVPQGVTVDGEAVKAVPKLEFDLPETVEWRVTAAQALKAPATVTVEAPGLPRHEATAELTFSPAVPLVRATYVPEPKPVRGPYEVGVYYFPGWYDASRWQPIQPFPERTPMLGWYQEGSPEVADWHIKWAVEHGITFFAYDWYWVKGARSLEHGLHDGYLKARYRHLLKFCLLWANHNPKNTSSEEDLLNVTDYWIDHYFKLPEHLTIDGKPVVIIFSPYRLQEDMGSDAVRVAFEKMRARCRERGLPGLYLTACGNTQLSFLKVRQQEGYDGVTSYNWPRAGMKADEVRAPYDALVDAYPALWKEALDADLVKLMPVPLCGGWDSRPWHGPGALARLGMNPDNFKRHCADAKRLIDERKIAPKMVIVEAWNEWGEGSYIEPHKQFGFGYLDAIREVFTDAPKEHSDLAPQDVGLGPYDVKPFELKTAWEFNKDGDREGWTGFMQTRGLEAKDGVLRGESVGNDPALGSPPVRAKAAQFPYVIIRMKSSLKDTAQLFWATASHPHSERTSIRFDLPGDNQFHVYSLPVGQSRSWRGTIMHLRLDPGNTPGAKFEIDYVRLAEKPQE